MPRTPKRCKRCMVHPSFRRRSPLRTGEPTPRSRASVPYPARGGCVLFAPAGLHAEPLTGHARPPVGWVHVAFRRRAARAARRVRPGPARAGPSRRDRSDPDVRAGGRRDRADRPRVALLGRPHHDDRAQGGLRRLRRGVRRLVRRADHAGGVARRAQPAEAGRQAAGRLGRAARRPRGHARRCRGAVAFGRRRRARGRRRDVDPDRGERRGGPAREVVPRSDGGGAGARLGHDQAAGRDRPRRADAPDEAGVQGLDVRHPAHAQAVAPHAGRAVRSSAGARGSRAPVRWC